LFVGAGGGAAPISLQKPLLLDLFFITVSRKEKIMLVLNILFNFTIDFPHSSICVTLFY
jgi:hypothetical protein